VTFQLYDIKEALTKESIRKTLRNLPKTLSETYTRIIERTYHGPAGSEKIELMERVFRWITVAQRPLRIAELVEAVALDPSDTYLHGDRMPVEERLISACSNLASYNEDDDTVTFVHYTVKQYLDSAGHVNSQTSRLINLESSRDIIGNICLTYLSFPEFETQLVKMPAQPQINQSIAEGIFWSNVPLGSHLRNLVSRTHPWRRKARDRSGDPVYLVLPTPSGPSVLLTNKYALLEYVVENWVAHTAHLRSYSSLWATFKHISLHRQLAFEHRPWNEPAHLGRCERTTQTLMTNWEARNHPLFTKQHMPAWSAQLAMQSWAFTYAIGSLLGLVEPQHLKWYLRMLRFECIPDVLESDWVDSNLVKQIYTQFPRTSFEANTISMPANQPNCSWSGCTLMRLLIAGGNEQTESVFTYLSLEICRWLSNSTWDWIIKETLVCALAHGSKDIFEFTYEKYLDTPQDSTEICSALQTDWQAYLVLNLVTEVLNRPNQDATETSTMEWDILFFFHQYFTYPNNDMLLRLSHTAQARANTRLGDILVVMALADRSNQIFILNILMALGRELHYVVKLNPSTDWRKATLSSRAAFSKIQSFLGFHVVPFNFALLLAVVMDHFRDTKSNRWAQTSTTISPIWSQKLAMYSIEVFRESLDSERVYLSVKWSVFDQDTEQALFLVPLSLEFSGFSELSDIAIERLENSRYTSEEPPVLQALVLLASGFLHSHIARTIGKDPGVLE
jgi:hypothetical protein